MRRRKLASLAPVLLLASCIPPPRGQHPSRPGPMTPFPRADAAAAQRQCIADLSRYGRIQALPDRVFPGGCSAVDAVKLVAIGIPVTNLGAMTCRTALPFTRWVREAVPAEGVRWLGSPVVKIESFGTFACRPINNQQGNQLSEHARANAVDIAAFDLADGRRITVAEGWNGPDPAARGFLRAVHGEACRRFSVVLGPDANALHRDHIHMDMGSGRLCR